MLKLLFLFIFKDQLTVNNGTVGTVPPKEIITTIPTKSKIHKLQKSYQKLDSI